MKHLFYFLIIIITASCGSIKTATPTIIGIMPLTSYTVQDQSPSADTAYRVIRSEDVFNSSFSASAADARKPDFGGQTVVAILFKNAASQPGMQFQKAEIVGKAMNVYAVSCAAGTVNCIGGPVVMATTPKGADVSKVQFFINGESRSTISF